MNILKLQREGGGKENRPLVSVFLFFSLFFFLHTDNVYIFIGLINVWKDCQEGTKRKMGPNDVFHVVWAIVSFSLLLSVFFYIY